MIAGRREEDLRLVLQAAEGLAVNHAVAVALKRRANRILRLGAQPSFESPLLAAWGARMSRSRCSSCLVSSSGPSRSREEARSVLQRSHAEPLRERLAEIRKGVAIAHVDRRPNRRAADEHRHVFARVIRAGRGGIVAVIGGDDEDVVGRAAAGAAPAGVEPLEILGVLHLVAMAVDGVEVHQVGEDQAPRGRRHRRLDFVHAVIVTGGVDRRRHAAPGEQILDFPIATTGRPAAFNRSSRVGANGVSEKSRRLAVRLNAPGAPMNGPRDHTADPCPSATSSYAISQIRYSSGTGMTSSCAAIWKTLSGGGVNDWLAGFHVLRPELVDDGGAGGDGVAENLPANAAFELGDQLGRSRAGKRGTPDRARVPSAPNAR